MPGHTSQLGRRRTYLHPTFWSIFSIGGSSNESASKVSLQIELDLIACLCEGFAFAMQVLRFITLIDPSSLWYAFELRKVASEPLQVAGEASEITIRLQRVCRRL